MKNLPNHFYLAWRYLAHHRLRTVIIVVALALVLSVPIIIESMMSSAQYEFNHRSEQTPLLLGAKGSQLDLTLQSLYYIGEPLPTITISQLHKVAQQMPVKTIPLYTGYFAKSFPIVGTEPAYLKYRQLDLAQGRHMQAVTEAVIGDEVAQALGVKLGDTIASSSQHLFNINFGNSLDMTVVGILQPTATVDNQAIFINMESVWVLAGIGHAHDDEDLHFHGDKEDFPITSGIVIPDSQKTLAILLGRYLNNPKNLQLIQPKHSIQALLSTIFKVKKVFYSILMTAALSSLLTLLLAFILTYKLRHAEIRMIKNMGSHRATVLSLISAEILLLFAMSIFLSIVIFAGFYYFSQGWLINLTFWA